MQCMRCRRVIPDDAVFCCYCGVRQSGAPAAQRRRRRRPRGTGSVWKDARNKSRPFVAVAADGTRIGTFATSGEAVKALDDVNASKISPERQTYTLADVYDRWSELHYPKITVKAQQSYANVYRKAAALHDRRIAELKTEDYQRVLSQMMAAGASRSLCEKERQLFSQLCQYAINQDIIHTNYSTALVLPDASAPKTRVLSADEVQAIRNAADDARLGETARIALTLIYTGMRLNELLTARRENVHADEGYLIGGEKTEAGRDRVIPLHPDIMPYILQWLDGNDAPYLIPSKYGLPRDHNNVRKSFNSLMRKLGIEGVTPHTCRHTAATKFAATGLPPEVTKQILGHADITTTLNIYTHPNIQYLIENARRVKWM